MDQQHPPARKNNRPRAHIHHCQCTCWDRKHPRHGCCSFMSQPPTFPGRVQQSPNIFSSSFYFPIFSQRSQHTRPVGPSRGHTGGPPSRIHTHTHPSCGAF
ncbi:unnamed protein product, partial [Ectocarpus fasciculatus]